MAASMNVLVLGAGGREHALALAIARSPYCSRLICAPGNPGMASLAPCLPVDPMDAEKVISLCRKENVNFVVIGPEQPLVAGLTDALLNAGIRSFGPSMAAARLEGSKGFTKDLCRANAIPTADSYRFTDLHDALEYIKKLKPPIVVKADGLAAGKGVTVASEIEAACEAAYDIFQGASGMNHIAVIIEEYVEGEEASLFALVDGTTVLPLAGAQDHKRAFDRDKGPNTGGMGAYSPAPILDDAMARRAIDEIVRPTVQAMVRHGSPFRGILYAGLMITSEGPKLIEYNVRFGDPECQTLLVRLKSDLLPLLLATAEGRLENQAVVWHDNAALTVVMANSGYPGPYKSGSTIEGLEDAARVEGTTIFHAGTAVRNNRLVATGGRVLNITAWGETIDEAQKRAYKAVEQIHWPECFYRRDIAWRALTNASRKPPFPCS